MQALLLLHALSVEILSMNFNSLRQLNFVGYIYNYHYLYSCWRGNVFPVSTMFLKFPPNNPHMLLWVYPTVVLYSVHTRWEKVKLVCPLMSVYIPNLKKVPYQQCSDDVIAVIT